MEHDDYEAAIAALIFGIFMMGLGIILLETF